jgi:hypothetical protein
MREAGYRICGFSGYPMHAVENCPEKAVGEYASRSLSMERWSLFFIRSLPHHLLYELLQL